jgi:hypothetical protein
MATVWKLQGGTVAVATALADLGLSNLVRTRRSLAQDELTFLAGGALVDSTALFAFGDLVTLTRTVGAGSPVKWFVGVCVEVPRRGRGGFESLSYRIAGTWWYFENLVYQQNWPTVASGASRRAFIVAGLSPSAGTRQNTKAFIQDVLDWLIASGPGAVTQYTAGDLPTGFQVPFTRLEAPTCAEAMQHIVRWQPDAATWFDYTTTPPTFNMKRRVGASTATYALTDFVEAALTPRNELKLDRLVIQYVTIGSGGSIALAQEVDPGGTTGREFGSAVFVIDNNYLPIAAGLAASYRAGLSTLQYSGRLMIEEDECAQSTLHPGHLLNITGGLAAWSTMAAQVQEIVEEIDAGRTTITVGPPNHIRLDDLIEVLRIARNQSDQYGGSGEILKSGDPDGYATDNRNYSAPLTYIGIVPTGTELATACAACYTGGNVPKAGDVLHLTKDGEAKFRFIVHELDTSSGLGAWVVGVTSGGVTKYGHGYQLAML